VKIIFIIESLGCGGKERRLVELLKALSSDNNYSIDLILMENEIHYEFVKELKINIHYIIRKRKKDFKVFFEFIKLFRKIKPEIIHSWGSMPSFYSVIIAKLLGIKFINGMITSVPLKLRIFSKEWMVSKITFPLSDLILANSNAGLKAYRAPLHKSKCIYNGFDFSRFEKRIPEEILRKKYDITNKFVVGMVASFGEHKDYETYFKVASFIISNRADIKFFAVGSGKQLSYFQERYGKYGDIVFTGRINYVESLIQIFDIGILMTVGEGISNAILECMAAEKPIIVSEGGATEELVENFGNGFIISQKSPEQLSEKILYFLENPEVRKRMGLRSKKIIEERFSYDSMIRNFKNCYKNLLNNE